MGIPARSGILNLLQAAAGVLCAIVSGATYSADGDVKFAPKLDIAYARNSNFYYQSTNKTTSNGLILSPALLLSAESSRLRTSASLSGSYAQFDARGDDDNYSDATVAGSLEYKAGTSHIISVDGKAQYGHDPFGQDRTQGVPIVGGLDQWALGSGNFRYHFGAPEALFNFEVSGTGTKKIYTSNTSATKFLDYGIYGGTLTSFINISPKTAILAEGGYSQVRFDNHFITTTDDRAADEFFGRIGARWKAAAKTTGDVRAGWVERNSAATGLRTFQAFDWNASLTWQPDTRTTFSAITGRQSQESYLAGTSVILNKSYALSWTQNWTRRWASILKSSYIHSDFAGSGRADDISGVGLLLNYQAEKYLGIGLGTDYLHRYSNVPLSNFNGINIYSNVSLGF